MAVRMKGSHYYITFRWKGHRMDTGPPATSLNEAKRIDRAVEPRLTFTDSTISNRRRWEVVSKIFRNKGWKLPGGDW